MSTSDGSVEPPPASRLVGTKIDAISRLHPAFTTAKQECRAELRTRTAWHIRVTSEREGEGWDEDGFHPAGAGGLLERDSGKGFDEIYPFDEQKDCGAPTRCSSLLFRKKNPDPG